MMNQAITTYEIILGKKRFITLGMDPMARLMVVVYTWREDSVRIISARKATPQERHQYEKHL